MWNWYSYQEISGRCSMSDPVELYHHGILGMKWGVRRYQNEDGTLTPAGRRRIQKHPEQFSEEQVLREQRRLSVESNLKAMARREREESRGPISKFIRNSIASVANKFVNKAADKAIDDLVKGMFDDEETLVDLNKVDLSKPLSDKDMKRYSEYARNLETVSNVQRKRNETDNSSLDFTSYDLSKPISEQDLSKISKYVESVSKLEALQKNIKKNK